MSGQAGVPGLRHNRNWQWLWRGQSISVIGDMVFLVTVMLWIATRIAAGQSWAPAAVSGALIAIAAPAMIVGPFAGVWVDRWDRRRIMLTADAARFVLIASLLALPLLRHAIPVAGQLALLYAVLAAAGCFAEFFNPSRLAVIGAIVPQADQPKASGQLQAVMAFAQVIGPTIAAPLLITFGVQWALIVNAGSFGVSFLCVRAIRLPSVTSDAAPGRASFGAEFRAGVRFFASSKVMVGSALGSMIVMVGAGAINAIGVFFVIHDLHVSAGWLGAISGAVGVGAVAGALGTGLIAHRVGLGRLMWLALIVGGCALIGLSLCTELVWAIGACVLLGVAVGVVNAVDTPITLRVTPAHMMGRVSAVFSPLVQLSNIAGMALAGLLAGGVLRSLHVVIAGVTFGPYDSVIAAAGLLFILGGLATVAPMRHLPPAAPDDESADASQLAVGAGAPATTAPQTGPAQQLAES
jgi:MFS family permease